MTAAIAALFIALLALPQTAQAQSKEAYVVENGSTLTFYYDANKATHTTGTVYGINDKRKDDTMSPAWAGTDDDPNERITKVVFDSSFKDYRPATTNCWFYFCSKLTAIEGMSNLITDQVTDMYCMFNGCESLKALDVAKYNTAKVTDMKGMFCGCSALTSLDVSNFNTANVTDMSYMFVACSALETLVLSNFNTANVTYMNAMFYYCSSLKSLNLSSFNTAKVTGMSDMFYGCKSLTSLNVSNFDTGNVTSMSSMFYGCSALTSIDVTNFNTANVNNMWSMFNGCSALTSLDVSNFNTEKVTDMSAMFNACLTLTTIFCNDDWKSDVVKKSSNMFTNCKKLKGAVSYDANKTDVTMANPTTGYFTKIGKITPVAYVVEDGSTLTFYYDTNKATRTGTVYGINQKRADDTKVPAWAGLPVDPNERITKVVFDSSFKDYKPATTNLWFFFCKKLTEFEGMSNLITDQVTDMSYMFCWCSSLTSLDVSNFNTANVTDMSSMFSYCPALEALDLSNFNTANVTNMSYMFDGSSALTSLNVSNFDTGNVTDMYCMFRGCSSLKSLDVTNLNTAKVTDMMFMFNGCSSLTSIDVTNFNTAKVTAMTSMFYGCSTLTTIFCNDDWKSDVVRNSPDMFKNCTKLKGAVSYDANRTDVTMANPTTGYFTKKSATGITHPTAAEPLKRQGIYNLQGVKMQGSLDLLPAGVYIVDGKKIVKK